MITYLYRPVHGIAFVIRQLKISGRRTGYVLPLVNIQQAAFRDRIEGFRRAFIGQLYGAFRIGFRSSLLFGNDGLPVRRHTIFF
jgi:hypothetical protein